MGKVAFHEHDRIGYSVLFIAVHVAWHMVVCEWQSVRTYSTCTNTMRMCACARLQSQHVNSVRCVAFQHAQTPSTKVLLLAVHFIHVHNTSVPHIWEDKQFDIYNICRHEHVYMGCTLYIKYLSYKVCFVSLGNTLYRSVTV